MDCESTGGSDLSEVVEHAMRICSDELLVASVLTAQPGSRTAAVALGRILSGSCSLTQHLPADSPLVAWVQGRPWSASWRSHCQCSPGCLLNRLEDLRHLTESNDNYENLLDEWLSRNADFDFEVSEFSADPEAG